MMLNLRRQSCAGKLEGIAREEWRPQRDSTRRFHTRTTAQSPQTNGICERFHRTILNEFYQVAFRKKIYTTLESIQENLDAWIDSYNHERTHQGKMCCGRTPMATFSARVCLACSSSCSTNASVSVRGGRIAATKVITLFARRSWPWSSSK